MAGIEPRWLSEMNMSVVWFDLNYRALRVTGNDAWSWLNGLVTCSVLEARGQKAVRGTLLTKQGKIQAEFYAIEHRECLVLAIAGGDVQSVLETLDSYLVMEDAEIGLADLSFSWAFGNDVVATTRRLDVDAHVCDVFALPACLCVMDADARARVAADPDSVEATLQQFEALRIQSGVAKYGVDFDEADNLHGAGLERKVVDWSKGCYLGQEVVCMQEMRGKVRKSVVGIEASDGSALFPGELRNDASEAVGKCTSAAGRYGLAQLRAPENATGTRLHLLGEGQSAGGTPVVVRTE